ncbi:winged helix-turn-helix transcriptional regulator [Pedobacter caeni]|uniref:Transcriptional regulator, HxlR family n=1 Tax=Pedobacter caeni TaxID=288992 RepID=A0A1M5KWB4_9SPHI|nr:helix-turn-helix domain-containing protein [Pedobacter caeni]SHG56960.1 transcriptional regulator, HxlR family [Pedobacter caeni]
MKKEDSTNSINKEFLHRVCKLNEGLDLISGRWKGIILIYISENINRFSLLKLALSDKITDQTLGRQLKELEKTNLIEKTFIPGFPARVDYNLTAAGAALLPILVTLDQWAEDHYPEKNDEKS